jgi:hypothetical protein
MKIFVIILAITSFSFLTGCYTMVGVAEEPQTYSLNEIEDEEYSSGYFDEEMEEDYELEQNEVNYEESSIDFFAVFSDALSGFISSGALNIVIDLSANSSSSSSESNDSDNKSRNNTGSRNYDRR